MSSQERNLDAAEYVIGTLSVVERKAFEVSIETDPATRGDVQFWERTFGSLNASVSPQAPPEDMWERIESDLSDTPEDGGTSSAGGAQRSTLTSHAANDNVAERLRRSRSRWRMIAIAASFVAIALAAFIINGPTNPFL